MPQRKGIVVSKGTICEGHQKKTLSHFLLLLNPSSSLCGLDFASRLADLAIPFRASCSLSSLLSGNLGLNVPQDDGDARSNGHLWVTFDKSLLMDGHNGMPVSRIRLGTQNEQVARTQHKPVRRDGLLAVLGIGLAKVKLALLTQAQRNDGSIRSNVPNLIRVVANVVIRSSIAREDCVINVDRTVIVEKLLLHPRDNLVQGRNSAHVPIAAHGCVLPARIRIFRHHRRFAIDAGHWIR